MFSHRPFLVELSEGHDWFLDRMKQLGYETGPGACFGVGHMGMQAFLAHDLFNFDRRLIVLKDIPAEKLEERIDTLKKEKLLIIESVKKIIGPFRTLNSEEISHLKVDDKLNQLAQTMDELLKEGKFATQQQRDAEFERRKKLLLFNAFVQAHVDKEIIKEFGVHSFKPVALEIPVFFEGVDLYQRNYEFPNLFTQEDRPISQTATPVLPLLVTKKLEEQGGLIKIKNDYTGLCNVKELTQYFESFRSALQNSTPPFDKRVAFIISSSNHTITVGYDGKKKQWYLIDANKLPTKKFPTLNAPYADKDFAKEVISSLSNNKTATFNLSIFANQINEHNLITCIDMWQQEAIWKSVHTPTITNG